MDLGMREGMLLLGLLVVLALLLGAYRRLRSEQRNPIRMAARLPEPGAAADPEADPWGKEIISPPRVKARRGGVLDDAAPVAGEASPPAPAAADSPEIPLLVNRVALATTAAARRFREESQAEARSAGQVPLLETPEPGFPDMSGPLPGVDKLFVLTVLARDPQGFDGNAVLQILLACDLRYGNMNIFHRHEESRGRGPVQFSVASLVEPGSFDLETMPSERFHGLCFFMSLPGPANPIKAFNYMVETAQCIVKNLGGELQDEAHSAVTLQTLEHARQAIRDFERRQLAHDH